VGGVSNGLIGSGVNCPFKAIKTITYKPNTNTPPPNIISMFSITLLCTSYLNGSNILLEFFFFHRHKYTNIAVSSR